MLPVELLENKIYLIRGTKVMIDKDLASLYGVPTKRLNEQVKRNKLRFPYDFMFELSRTETDIIVNASRSHFATLKKGGNVKYLPYAFTEQGISMLSSVLNSKRAILVNIAIMRAFVRIRQLMSSNKDLIRKLAEIEHKIGHHDQDINELFATINKILRYEQQPKNKFGFDTGIA